MSVTAGTRLGPYELSALIGAGGMGEVYKARDTRLGRDVALKVLPASFAADHERLRRFQQEAQAVAALSHPNILAVYDVGEDDGTHFLVSELLEGESLREMLVRGVPSHRKSVGYAIQIARGLAAAHGRGIAHRDLKPDNIFITRDGQVKILDFGLAKSVAPLQTRDGSASEATMTALGPATDAGTVMGTAGYMSPEQVRGHAVDCRTDIFSFGAVFYEMLTGVRAFKRDTAAETMTAILNEDPPETLATGKQMPPVLDRIVRHCLEKSPDERYQSARDLAFELEASTDVTPSAGLPAAKGGKRVPWWYWAIGAAVVIAAAAFAGWKAGSSQPVSNLQFHQVTYRRGSLTDARYTPDEQNILYTATWEGAKPEIYTVPVNGSGGHSIGITDARLLAVSKTGEIAVALSPDRIVGFGISIGTLARATSGAGAPKPEIENVADADYTPDGAGLAIVRYLPNKQVFQVEYPIGKVLFSAGAIDFIRFSPNGHYLAFISHGSPGDDRGNVMIFDPNGKKVAESPLYESVQGLAWTPSGKEVWFTSPLESGAIHAMSVSGKTREVLSVPGRLFLRDISANGQLLAEQGIVHIGNVVSTGDGATGRDLSWLDYGYLRAISDDGKMILFEEEGMENPNSAYTIYVRNTDGSPAVAIGEGYGIALSHDNQWALGLNLKDSNEWLLPVGAGEPRRLSTLDTGSYTLGGFTPDDKSVFYIAREPGHGFRTWLQDLSGGNPRPITPEGILGSGVSPDGKWLLAGLLSNGRPTLLVPMSGGAPVPIAGLQPKEFIPGWTSDGRLFVGLRPKPGMSQPLEKLDPKTGTRSPARDVPLPDVTGVRPFTLKINPDGTSYAYGYILSLSDLYTMSGAR